MGTSQELLWREFVIGLRGEFIESREREIKREERSTVEFEVNRFKQCMQKKTPLSSPTSKIPPNYISSLICKMLLEGSFQLPTTLFMYPVGKSVTRPGPIN